MMISDDKILQETVRLVGEGVSVTLPVNGRSMLPFIIGGQESVVLQKPVQPGVGDVVLAWADDCRYVVHRIILIDGDRVVLMGDGNIAGTEHCRLADIKAVATHVVGADERMYELNQGWRRWAAKAWYHLRPLRRYLLFIYNRL